MHQLFQAAVILMFSSALFTATGHLEPNSHLWRIVQAFVAVLFYLLRVYLQAVGHEHVE